MALYPSRCPIRPVDSDIRSLSKGCKSQIVKKIEIKETWMSTTKPGLTLNEYLHRSI